MFGISRNIRSREVVPCTRKMFYAAIDHRPVAMTCAEIEDALEACQRCEMSREDFETFKSNRKKRLPIFTPHATFRNGRRLNAEAIPSGLSMYDIDHIPDPRGYFAERIESRVEELGVALAHVTPSLRGLRLFFVIPPGMGLAEAQKWLSEQLGDADYDASVKDYARSSFVVPRSYVLFVNDRLLFPESAPSVGTAPGNVKRNGALTVGEARSSASVKGNAASSIGNAVGAVGTPSLTVGEVDSSASVKGGGTSSVGDAVGAVGLPVQAAGEARSSVDVKENRATQPDSLSENNECKVESSVSGRSENGVHSRACSPGNSVSSESVNEDETILFAENVAPITGNAKGVSNAKAVSHVKVNNTVGIMNAVSSNTDGASNTNAVSNTNANSNASGTSHVQESNSVSSTNAVSSNTDGASNTNAVSNTNANTKANGTSHAQESNSVSHTNVVSDTNTNSNANGTSHVQKSNSVSNTNVVSHTNVGSNTNTTNNTKAANNTNPTNSPDCTEQENEEQPSFKGIPYAEIIRAWFILAGGEPSVGERNDKLHRLACHLRYITDDNESLLLRIIPRYGLGENEMRSLIHSACRTRRCSLPILMKQAINLTRQDTTNDNNEENTTHVAPPPMPEQLPPLIALLTSNTPEAYKPAVAHAVFPPLATHLHRVRFEYIDNVEHEATLMNVLMAGTGAGKDCITMPINKLMADIRRRDAENLRREEEWKNEVNSKGANKDKRERPAGLVIQEIDADMTNPAFVMRTAEADGHFLYTKMNEIEQFDALKGSSRFGQQFQIMCLAFDPDNSYGQTRVGTQSVTKKVKIRFNWNASTTILKGKRYFARVLADGPVSRINFCTIPDLEIGADMPRYGRYTKEFDRQLKPYIDNLNQASGLIDCPEAHRLAWELKEENARFSRLSQSRVYENLSFRANVIAWLKACVLYIASGYKWDKTLEDFIRWSLRYDMWCKLTFFGDALQEIMEEQLNDEGYRKTGPQNLLELLPDVFTVDDVVALRVSRGMDAKGTRQMLYQWVYRKYILQVTSNGYRKSIMWKGKTELK